MKIGMTTGLTIAAVALSLAPMIAMADVETAAKSLEANGLTRSYVARCTSEAMQQMIEPHSQLGYSLVAKIRMPKDYDLSGSDAKQPICLFNFVHRSSLAQ